MRIIFAVDGSNCSKSAIRAVDKMKFPIGTEIKVVMALDFSEPLPVLDEVKYRETQAANDIVARAIEELKEAHPNAEVKGTILDGYPIEAILQLSRDWLADLIILGSHGRKGASRLWLGSVSRAILLHAPCAVRIVRESHDGDNERGSNVLLALDDSEHSQHLVDHVLALPWMEGTKFRCLHVVHSLNEKRLTSGENESFANCAASLDDSLEQQKEWVRAAAQRINNALGQDVASAEVLLGDAREKILESAGGWPADIVMLGSHGRRGIDKLIMGSVSDAVATNAACSVEITRIPAFRKRHMHVIV